MPHHAAHWEHVRGAVVGDGHCVALVRELSGLPPTARWIEGEAALDADLQRGTILATFGARGTYENRSDGRSHACIFVHHQEGGLWVFDQWRGHPADYRLIRNKSGIGLPVDDAAAYAVVELA
jgi:hypothetical protein